MIKYSLYEIKKCSLEKEWSHFTYVNIKVSLRSIIRWKCKSQKSTQRMDHSFKEKLRGSHTGCAGKHISACTEKTYT